MRDEHKSQIVLLLVALLSGALHGGAWLGLGLLPPLEAMLAELREFEVEIVDEPPPPPPEPEPEPERPPEPEPPPPAPEPEPVRERRPEPVPVRTAEPPPAPTPEPPPIEERIEDFTGETLTNPDGESWTTALGSGAPMEGPIGASTGTTTGRARSGEAGGAIGGTGSGTSDDGEPALVDLADLSRPPRVPEGLADSLVRFYPAELRSRGVEGTATVRFRLLPGGRLTRFRLQNESTEGFGQACIDMLQASSGSWEQVHDRAGNVVATTVSFTCRFSLRF